jgi:hypothetical protein
MVRYILHVNMSELSERDLDNLKWAYEFMEEYEKRRERQIKKLRDNI